MYFYTQFSHTTRNRFSAANQNHAANLLHSEIYNDLLQDFYDKHELPSLHHDGDGFRQGDATDEELVELATTLKIELNNRFSPVFHFLDKEFMSIEEEKYDAILAKYEDDTFQELKEKYEIETYGTSVYVCLDEYDTEEFDVDDFVQEAEQLIALLQGYEELPNNVNIEFIETEEKDNSIRAIFHKKKKFTKETAKEVINSLRIQIINECVDNSSYLRFDLENEDDDFQVTVSSHISHQSEDIENYPVLELAAFYAESPKKDWENTDAGEDFLKSTLDEAYDRLVEYFNL